MKDSAKRIQQLHTVNARLDKNLFTELHAWRISLYIYNSVHTVEAKHNTPSIRFDDNCSCIALSGTCNIALARRGWRVRQNQDSTTHLLSYSQPCEPVCICVHQEQDTTCTPSKRFEARALVPSSNICCPPVHTWADATD